MKTFARLFLFAFVLVLVLIAIDLALLTARARLLSPAAFSASGRTPLAPIWDGATAHRPRRGIYFPRQSVGFHPSAGVVMTTGSHHAREGDKAAATDAVAAQAQAPGWRRALKGGACA